MLSQNTLFIKKISIISIVFVSFLLIFSCRQTGTIRKPDRMPSSILVNYLKTSPDKPVELCDEGDLQRFFGLLKCYQGDEVYRTLERIFSIQDKKFKHKTEGGYEVMKFDFRCTSKVFEIYLTTDACDKISEYEEYNIEDHRFTDEDYDDKSREYDSIDSYDEIAEPFEVLEPEEENKKEQNKE